jgi:hypothetical protein
MFRGLRNLLILKKEESAKRPTQACLSYNYRTVCLFKLSVAGSGFEGAALLVRTPIASSETARAQWMQLLQYVITYQEVMMV